MHAHANVDSKAKANMLAFFPEDIELIGILILSVVSIRPTKHQGNISPTFYWHTGQLG
jgi:hypothetical protein